MKKTKQQVLNSFSLVSGLAQELDSPLKSILGRTKKLINEYKTRDFEYISFKDFKMILATLEQLERQLERCSQTASRMLFLGKRQARLPEDKCQVNEIIKSTLDELSVLLKSSHIRLVSRLTKELPLAALGPVECYQVVHNVIVNAIQAMPSGGTIKVKTVFDKARGLVGINVADEGVGITPDHLSKVFEPFFTTKERGIDKSAGLGLSIIHAIANSVGGSVHIKSSLRKGTTVEIALPAFKSK